MNENDIFRIQVEFTVSELGCLIKLLGSMSNANYCKIGIKDFNDRKILEKLYYRLFDKYELKGHM